MHPESAESFARKISEFCRKRISTLLPPREVERIRLYMVELTKRSEAPPTKGRGFDWITIAFACQIELEHVLAISTTLRPGFEAIARGATKQRATSRATFAGVVPRKRKARQPSLPDWTRADAQQAAPPSQGRQAAADRRRGPKKGQFAKEVVEFPEPLFREWDEPTEFHEALALHMKRHGDTYWQLHRAVIKPDELLDNKTIGSWVYGTKMPRSRASLEVLGRIERRYRLPDGYFRTKLPHPVRATSGHRHLDVPPSERRRIAWHLPDDFDQRPLAEREEILEWVRTVVVSGGTEYRRFQAAAMKTPYAIRFPSLTGRKPRRSAAFDEDDSGQPSETHPDADPELISGAVDAPFQLEAEMAALIRFKTATLTAIGQQRNGVWGDETASQKIEHLGLMFGALAAACNGAARGHGVPRQSLTFGLLAFPKVWDWYLGWREQRRGFFTAWEVDMLRVALALTRQETGWLRQTPAIADALRPIAGLLGPDEIDAARTDWGATCDAFHRYALGRVKEVQRVARVHRDPFEPILPILEADSPVGEYRKITQEILRLMPDERKYPLPAAESTRSFLLLRLGLHLGLRQKNLRQLMVCRRGWIPRSERHLTDAKRGELRWSEKERGWEVFIPSVAFKNANSSFFGSKPFRLVLPDLDGLYDHLSAYVERHRRVLLGGADDPGTFFVKTAKVSSVDAAYDQNTFYEAWRCVIQRYGIYNPYTKRGAIVGLLPHGPHNIRDVLATHILKLTGSYEQASYAIQDTPDMVAKHYGRFLPQDKAALAAQILNKVWEAA